MGSYTKKNRNRRHRGVRWLLILLLAGCIAFFILPGLFGPTEDCSAGGAIFSPAADLVPPSPVTIPSNGLYSENALLIRLSDQSVLLAKENSQRAYPASLTKMMTVLTFLENYAKDGESPEDLLARLQSEVLSMPPEIYPILEKRHASMAGLNPGETVSYLDLLYACHLPSGADGSMGLAYSLSGSEEAFVALMNEKAAELGMKNTHFANVTGLHDPQHYTTADDLALLVEHALQNQLFREIFTAKKYTTTPTASHPEGLSLRSTLSFKMENPQANRTTVLGGKTGFTEEAGLCLASLAKKGSKEYILITMGAPGNNYTEQFNISDAIAIYEAL